MPDRLSAAEWDALLDGERDTFKLTIRAWAAIEAEIDAGSEALLRQPMPGGMQGLGPIGKRISVASALGVVHSSIAPALRALQRLRNDFAHGDIHDLDDQRADALLQKLRETDVLSGDLARIVARTDPLIKLQTVLQFVMISVQKGGEIMLDLQQQGDRALAVRHVAEQRRKAILERLAAEQVPEATD